MAPTDLEEIRTRAHAMLTTAPDRYVVAALLELEGREARTDDEDVARSWLLDEIERRYPLVRGALDAWAADLDLDLTYVEALLEALPAAKSAACEGWIAAEGAARWWCDRCGVRADLHPDSPLSEAAKRLVHREPATL